MKQILDAEHKIIVLNLDYFKDKHINYLLQLLQKYEEMFDRTIGKYTSSNYTIELKEYAKIYSFPKIHQPTIKNKIDGLI